MKKLDQMGEAQGRVAHDLDLRTDEMLAVERLAEDGLMPSRDYVETLNRRIYQLARDRWIEEVLETESDVRQDIARSLRALCRHFGIEVSDAR